MKKIRIYEGNRATTLRVCEHISINGELVAKNDSPEYTEKLKIRCNTCNRTYSFEDWIG